jgi:F-type H+-transporting ATPase subunit gamma
MSGGSAGLRQKLSVAADLKGVVRTMKAIAASRIGDCERAVRALADYDRAVKLGLAATLRASFSSRAQPAPAARRDGHSYAIVFGSDQGLVGAFNERIAEFAIRALATLPGPTCIWVVGSRLEARIAESRCTVQGVFSTPADIAAVTGLVEALQLQAESLDGLVDAGSLYLIHHREIDAGGYAPVCTRLLPLDQAWRDAMIAAHWPTPMTPDLLADTESIVRALVREYLFIALFQACAESIASENASRLSAMQRAEKNIDQLSEDLTRRFHRIRQASIDEDLFEVVSGFEALT